MIHVKAFKYSPTYEWGDGAKDFYRLEMDNFRNPWVAGFYVLSMVVVGSHLWHGASSALQSLGVDHRGLDAAASRRRPDAGVLIAAAFIAITLWAHFVASQA